MNPEITSTDARVTVNWVLDVHIEPGSVPDRPTANRAHLTYRPDWLNLAFQAIALGTELRRLRPGSGRMERMERQDVKLTAMTVSGPRVRLDGTAGSARHNEYFFAYTRNAPEWAQQLAASALADLRSGDQETQPEDST